MTIEHRLVFGLEDLQVLRLQCAQCRGSFSYRLEQIVRAPDVCPNCHQRFSDRGAPGMIPQIKALVDALRDLRDIKQPDLRVQFEIEPPPH